MSDPRTPSKALNVSLWIAQVLLAALMIMGAVIKYQPIEKISTMMPWAGEVPLFVVRLLGTIDMLGGVGLILPALLGVKPQLTAWAALGVLALMVSASVFHVLRGEGAVIGMNVFAAFTAVFVIWGRFKKVPITTR